MLAPRNLSEIWSGNARPRVSPSNGATAATWVAGLALPASKPMPQ
jgi:Helix-turn-helix domain of resolvase.